MSAARRVEDACGDLDIAWNKDRLVSLLQRLAYSAADKASGAPNCSGINIHGDIYNGLATCRASVDLYRRFLEAGVAVPIRDADRVRDYLIAHYVRPAHLAGRSLFTIRSGDVHNALGFRNKTPTVCSAIESDRFARTVSASLTSREGPGGGSNVYYEFQFLTPPPFGLEAALVELRRRYREIPETAKMFRFELPDGRQIALEHLKQVQMWFEAGSVSGDPPSASFERYDAARGRNTNLPPRLRHDPPGDVRARPVVKTVLSDMENLLASLAWYESATVEGPIDASRAGWEPVRRLQLTAAAGSFDNVGFDFDEAPADVEAGHDPSVRDIYTFDMTPAGHRQMYEADFLDDSVLAASLSNGPRSHAGFSPIGMPHGMPRTVTDPAIRSVEATAYIASSEQDRDRRRSEPLAAMTLMQGIQSAFADMLRFVLRGTH